MRTYGFTSDDSGDMSMSSNMMKVQVYLTSLNVEIVTESPTYKVWNVIKIAIEAAYKYEIKQISDGSYMSALGGAISLYLGISFAMVFEVIELIIDFFINCFTDKMIKRKMWLWLVLNQNNNI